MADKVKTKHETHVPEQHSFKMLLVIVEHGRAEDIVKMLAEINVVFHIVCMGDGTADNSLLQLLNLDQSDKDVIISIIESSKAESALASLSNIFEGSGVAFTIKLSSIGGRKTLQLLKGNFSELEEKKV